MSFIYQASRVRKFRVLSVVLIILLFLGMLYWLFGQLSLYFTSVAAIIDWFKFQITQVTPIGLFFGSLFGSLFFLPVPIDIIFFTGLAKDANPVSAFVLVLAGSVIGNYLDYVMGRFLSPYARYLVSVKKLYGAKRWVNKYGAWAIFLFNLTPLPGSLLTFAVGITRYNMMRLFVFFILGNMCKFGVYVWIYFTFGNIFL